MTSKEQPRTSCFTLALQRCNEKPTYTIHGLWPYTRNARLKPLCRLDALSIKSLWKDLDRYHKNCFGNNIQFLEYQWCKHGIYAFSTPSEYFQLASTQRVYMRFRARSWRERLTRRKWLQACFRAAYFSLTWKNQKQRCFHLRVNHYRRTQFRVNHLLRQF